MLNFTYIFNNIFFQKFKLSFINFLEYKYKFENLLF